MMAAAASSVLSFEKDKNLGNRQLLQGQQLKCLDYGIYQAIFIDLLPLCFNDTGVSL